MFNLVITERYFHKENAILSHEATKLQARQFLLFLGKNPYLIFYWRKENERPITFLGADLKIKSQISH